MLQKMKYLKVIMLLTIVATIISCSSKKKGLESMIPEDAKIVVGINAGKLMEKLAANGISGDSIPLGLMSLTADDAANKPVAKFLNGLDTIGIDFAQPIYMAISASKDVTVPYATLRVIAKVTDKAKVTKMLKNNKMDVQERNGLTFVTTLTDERDNAAIGYDGTYIVLAKDMPLNELMNSGTRGLIKGNGAQLKDYTPLNAKQLEDIVVATFSKKTKSITDNKDFNKMPVGTNDIKIWYDMGYFIQKAQSENQFAQIGTRIFKDLFDGCSTTTTINFENGKVAAYNELYYNDSVSAIINRAASKTIDLNLLSSFPGTQLNGVYAMSADPSMLLNFAKFVKGDGIMNIALEQLQLTTEDVFKTFSGDVLIAVADLNAQSYTTSKAENLNIGLIAKVANKDVLAKIMAIPDIAKSIKLANNIYTMQSTNNEPTYITIVNDVLLLTPNKKMADDFNAGKKMTISPTIIENLTGKSAGYYIDAASIVKSLSEAYKPMLAGYISTTKLSSISSIIKETYMSSGKFTGNSVATQGYLILDNTTQNSLAYMIKQGVVVAKEVITTRAAFNSLDEEDDAKIKPMPIN